eukprot:762058-Hanusia_phi.AAC.3
MMKNIAKVICLILLGMNVNALITRRLFASRTIMHQHAMFHASQTLTAAGTGGAGEQTGGASA